MSASIDGSACDKLLRRVGRKPGHGKLRLCVQARQLNLDDGLLLDRLDLGLAMPRSSRLRHSIEFE